MWDWLLNLFRHKKSVTIKGASTGWTINSHSGTVITKTSHAYGRGGFGTGKFGN